MRLLVAMAIALLPALAHAAPHLTLEEPQLHLTHTAPQLTPVQLAFDEGTIPLDQGGGARASSDPATRQVICFILGFFPGFGIGHLLAGSKDGFVLFLIVDVVILTAAILLTALAPVPFYALFWLGWILEHVFQGYDAYTAAGGEHLVQRSLDRVIEAPETPRLAMPTAPTFTPTVRTLGFNF